MFGLIEVSTGGGLLITTLVIVKTSEPLVPPPGVPVNTVIFAVPAVVISAAGTVAVNCVELPKLVDRSTPFHLTTEPLMKLLPVIVIVKAADPATALFGEIVMAVGTGLLGVVPPPPPEESDFLQELNNKKMMAKASSLDILIAWFVYAGIKVGQT